MKKIGIYMLRFAWCALIMGATLWTMFVTAVLLHETMPEDLSPWVQFIIAIPCLCMAPLCVEVALIAITRKIDRYGWLGA